MSKRERDFHKLIKQHDSESREKLWEDRIKNKIPFEGQEEAVNNGGNTATIVKRAVIPAVAVFAVVLTLILLLVFKPWVKQSKFRYCSIEDYTINSTDMTLKDYSERIGEDLLYFDWYNKTETLLDYVYQLNNTSEIICFSEEMTDVNTGSTVSIYVTDNFTKIDFLEAIYESCIINRSVENVNVSWQISDFDASAHFEYNSYNYCLRIENPTDENYLFSLIGHLLNV